MASAAPNYIQGADTHILNLRAGACYRSLEIAGHVKNAGDSCEWISLNQAAGGSYLAGDTVMPRVIGLQMNYRF